MGRYREQITRITFFTAASVSVAAVILICLFLFFNGIPAIKKIGIGEFTGGELWRPSQGDFGIFPMIIGSIYVTAGAVIIGVPIGVLCAVFMAKYCHRRIYGILKFSVELMAGIPSVVYGFFGLMVIVPVIQELFGGSGRGLLTASVLLGIMILPTIINISEDSIRAVPENYYEGSLALGATKERSITKTVLPAARTGIMSGVILGTGRAIGETMAVVMVCGNQAVIPESITSGLRTLTTNIVLEMGYAAELHRDALIGTAVVLFVFVFIINISFSVLKRGGK